MARIYFKNFQSLDSMAGMLSVAFALNGTSDPNLVYGRGVATVVRTGVGKFTVTLGDTYPVMRGVNATPNIGTTAPGVYSIEISASSAPGPSNSFAVQLYAAGVAADVNTGTGFVISCLIPFSVYQSDAYSQPNA